MATNSANVRVAVTGEVLVGATSATAPTGTGSTTTGFTGLGYVGEDGVTESRDRSTNDIKAWQGATTVRTVVTDATYTFNFTLIETSVATAKLFYGVSALTSQTGTEGSITVIPANTGGRQSFILDVVDGAELERIYIPQGEVTEVGDLVYSSGEAVGYEVTVTAYPDTTLGGNAKVWRTAWHS